MAFLPPSTNADYRGAPSSAAFLGLAAVMTLVPGLIHSFLPDGGAGVIAGLDLGERRDLVVGVFAWEGATQLALGLGMLAVALRYRPLTPLFLVLVIVERGLMTLQGWALRPPASGHHPPEHYATPVAVVLALGPGPGAPDTADVSRIALLGAACLALSGCGAHNVSKETAGHCLADMPAAEAAPSTAGMVLIRDGDFQMGAKPLHREEGPPRMTRVAAFWIDRTEVTNAQFAAFVAATGYKTLAERPLDSRAYPGLSGDQLKPSAIVFVGAAQPAGSDPGAWWRVVQGADWRHPEGPDSSIAGREAWPVVQVGWDDAMAYARWLGRDLPTEAEWEYAAQGGKRTATRFVWGDQPLDEKHPQANVWQGIFPAVDSGGDGYKARAAPVGCFPANGYGLYDMAGNVWEWTRDWYRPNLRPDAADNPGGPPQTLAFDPGDPGQRKHVIKGGSFLCSPNYCYRYRPAAREPGPTDTGENHIGFRTVLRPPA